MTAGTLTVDASKTLRIRNGATVNLTNSSRVTNNGTIEIDLDGKLLMDTTNGTLAGNIILGADGNGGGNLEVNKNTTLTGALTQKTTTSASAVKINSGATMTLSGASSTWNYISGTVNNQGTITVAGGKLNMSSATSVFTNAGTMNLNTGSIELDTTRATGATSNNIISNTGTVQVGTNFKFDFKGTAISTNGTIYTIISGGTINGWSSLSKSNFSDINGAIAANARINLATPGKVAFIVVDKLYWNMQNSTAGVWSTNVADTNWRTETNGNVVTGWEFISGDNVAFDGKYQASSGATNKVDAPNATVNIAEDITAGTVEVMGGANVTLQGQTAAVDIIAQGDVTISSGSTLSVGNNAQIINESKIINEGTLNINSSNAISNNGDINNLGTFNINENLRLDGIGAFNNGGILNIADGKTFGSASNFNSVANGVINLNNSGNFDLLGRLTVAADMAINSSSASSGTFDIKTSTAILTMGANITNNATINLTAGGLVTTTAASANANNIIINTGTVNVSSDFLFYMSTGTTGVALDVTGGTTYTIISGGNIVGWDKLTISNFVNEAFAAGRSYIVDVSVAGQVKFSSDADKIGRASCRE